MTLKWPTIALSLRRFVLSAFLGLGLCAVAQAQNFRIQICAFSDSIQMNYFTDRGIEGVTVERGQDRLYKYFLGRYRTRTEAEAVQDQLIERGFNSTQIIDIEAVRVLSDRQCGYQDGRYEPFFDQNVPNPIGVIYYEDGKTDVPAAYKSVLDRYALRLKTDDALILRIMGFNDSKADAATSDRLATERTRLARNYLIAKGIRADRMVLEVYGEADPLLPNKDNQGNDLPNNQRWNRRVMLKFAEKQ
jgi:outer membrane protein OmpA-like peptidoglycan-associated protein